MHTFTINCCHPLLESFLTQFSDSSLPLVHLWEALPLGCTSLGVTTDCPGKGLLELRAWGRFLIDPNKPGSGFRTVQILPGELIHPKSELADILSRVIAALPPKS